MLNDSEMQDENKGKELKITIKKKNFSPISEFQETLLSCYMAPLMILVFSCFCAALILAVFLLVLLWKNNIESLCHVTLRNIPKVIHDMHNLQWNRSQIKSPDSHHFLQKI